MYKRQERSAFLSLSLSSLKAILLDDDREEDQEETKKKKTESCFLFSNLFLPSAAAAAATFLCVERAHRANFDVLLSS